MIAAVIRNILNNNTDTLICIFLFITFYRKYILAYCRVLYTIHPPLLRSVENTVKYRVSEEKCDRFVRIA